MGAVDSMLRNGRYAYANLNTERVALPSEVMAERRAGEEILSAGKELRTLVRSDHLRKTSMQKKL
jgi:hypothetical protein